MYIKRSITQKENMQEMRMEMDFIAAANREVHCHTQEVICGAAYAVIIEKLA